MPPPRRRVSYIIPPPSTPVPRLSLPLHGTPRNGAPGPILVNHASNGVDDTLPQWEQYPRHRLGVSCLALDTSTQLQGRDAPEGILYTAGRDGLVLSWDLGIPLKRRQRRYGLSDSDEMRRPVGRWEIMTGWEDDIMEEDTEDEEYRSDGDVLGDVHSNGRRGSRRHIDPTHIPYEEQWETDLDAFQHGKISQFRQGVQAHTDWVNDILLCNYNQTVVSASSDGTVKAWSPHSTTPSEPTTLGIHDDYARCLTQCRDRQWIASGSFDRTIKLWDTQRSNQDPLVTLHSPEGAKSSVYALTTDPYGMLVAAGSPERVVRMWDPRSGKRIGKLVGHTDNIRAILISEDAKYLLTGSADASIKLWSLATQKCLHTFTHHADSVWSLFSSHPSLEIFYSGDRSGIVCKVDVESCTDVSEGECIVLVQDSDHQSSSSSPSTATTDGVNRIVAMDDNLLWTATGSSSIKRWRVPGRRATRLDQNAEDGMSQFSPMDSPGIGERQSASPSPSQRLRSGPRRNSDLTANGPQQDADRDKEGEETWYGIPFESLVKLTSANEGFSGFGGGGAGGVGMSSRGRDPEIATLYSAASVMSVPRLVRSPLSSVFQSPAYNANNASAIIPRSMSPVQAENQTIHPLRTARAEFEEREMASDAVPLESAPDEVIRGDHGLVRCAILNDRVHALTVDTAGEVAVWDLVRGACLGRYSAEDIAEASFCERSSSGGSNNELEMERSPREALETVKERIEGEAVVAIWASVDTKTGLLTVHLNERCFEAEIYADEAGFGPDRHFSDEARINVGKWVLRNLFLHFIREEHRMASKRPTATESAHRTHRLNAPVHIDLPSMPEQKPRARSSSDASKRSQNTPTNKTFATVISSSTMLPAVAPPVAPPPVRSSPLLTPMIPLSVSGPRDASTLSPIPQSPMSADATPMPRDRRTASATENGAIGGTPRTSDYFSLRTRRPSVSAPSAPSTGASTAPTPGGGGGAHAVPPSPAQADDFGSWGGATPSVGPMMVPIPQTPTAATPTVPQTPTTPGGGLMGRLKAFGKGARRLASEGPMTPGGTVSGDAGLGLHDPANHAPPPKTPLQVLLSGPLNPPSSGEAPTLALPAHMSILISDESPGGSGGWMTVYRGHVGSTGQDVRALEEIMPIWLLEYLLVSKVPVVPAVKIGFVLLPWKKSREGGADGKEEVLPELLNTAQSKLTASRFLRVRKLTQHVQEKLDRLSNPHSTTSASTTAANTPRSSFDAPRSLKSVSRSPPLPSDSTPPKVPAEEQYEILCDDVVLPLDMTLAAVRQFVWRSSGELVMYYRRKVHTAKIES